MSTGASREGSSSFTDALRAWNSLADVGKGDLLALRDEPAPLVERPLAGGPRVVPVALATLVKASARLEPAEGEAMVGRLSRSEEDSLAEEWIAAAFEVVNRAIAAYRVAAWDPYAVEVARADARAVRVGYGDAEAVLDGGGTRSVEVSASRGRSPKSKEQRRAQLSASGTVALVLSGRGEILDAEELILRAQLDLAHGRTRLGVLGLDNGLALLATEFADGGPRLIAELRAELGPLLDQALAGVRFESGSPEREHAIDAALRARGLVERSVQEQRLVRTSGPT